MSLKMAIGYGDGNMPSPSYQTGIELEGLPEGARNVTQLVLSTWNQSKTQIQ